MASFPAMLVSNNTFQIDCNITITLTLNFRQQVDWPLYKSKYGKRMESMKSGIWNLLPGVLYSCSVTLHWYYRLSRSAHESTSGC